MRGTRRSTGFATIRLLPACAAALAALLLAVPARSGGPPFGPPERVAALAGRATSVAELARLYDSQHCGDCHVAIYRDWEKSIHARPLFGTGRTALTLLTSIANGLTKWPYSGAKAPADLKVEHLMVCAKCHLPQLADATDAVAREIVGDLLAWQEAVKSKKAGAARKLEEKITSLSINCRICHGRNAVVHKWADGFPMTREVYGAKEGPHFCGQFPSLKKSPIMGESLLCGQCHGQGPNFELGNPTQCATLYGSYLFAYLADGGRQTCQECHMRRSRLGHNIQSYRDNTMAKAAVDFQVAIRRILPDDAPGSVAASAPRIAVDVSMANRAGHSIPDG